jgi:molybdopterin-biosynthesis enzyme MoeA-like protein
VSPNEPHACPIDNLQTSKQEKLKKRQKVPTMKESKLSSYLKKATLNRRKTTTNRLKIVRKGSQESYNKLQVKFKKRDSIMDDLVES